MPPIRIEPLKFTGANVPPTYVNVAGPVPCPPPFPWKNWKKGERIKEKLREPKN